MEYRIEHLEGEEAVAGVVVLCNRLAKDGWLLVTSQLHDTLSTIDGAHTVYVPWRELIFRRSVTTE